MNNTEEYFVSLALGFLNNNLEEHDRHLVQQLIIESPEFLQILKTELRIQKAMNTLKHELPPLLKQRIFINITDNTAKIISIKIISEFLEATLANIMWPVIKILQRSV